MIENAYPIEAGDTVKINDGRRGWRDATVVKVGRTLVHIGEHGRTTAYYRVGQRRRDGFPGSFRTLAQLEDMERRRDLVEGLRAYGIEPRYTQFMEWTTDQLAKLLDAIVTIRLDKK